MNIDDSMWAEWIRESADIAQAGQKRPRDEWMETRPNPISDHEAASIILSLRRPSQDDDDFFIAAMTRLLDGKVCRDDPAIRDAVPMIIRELREYLSARDFSRDSVPMLFGYTESTPIIQVIIRNSFDVEHQDEMKDMSEARRVTMLRNRMTAVYIMAIYMSRVLGGHIWTKDKYPCTESFLGCYPAIRAYRKRISDEDIEILRITANIAAEVVAYTEPIPKIYGQERMFAAIRFFTCEETGEDFDIPRFGGNSGARVVATKAIVCKEIGIQRVTRRESGGCLSKKCLRNRQMVDCFLSEVSRPPRCIGNY